MQDPPRFKVWRSELNKLNSVIREPQEAEDFSDLKLRLNFIPETHFSWMNTLFGFINQLQICAVHYVSYSDQNRTQEYESLKDIKNLILGDLY